MSDVFKARAVCMNCGQQRRESTDNPRANPDKLLTTVFNELRRNPRNMNTGLIKHCSHNVISLTLEGTKVTANV